jgi:xanthine dehydrogenase small subunit
MSTLDAEGHGDLGKDRLRRHGRHPEAGASATEAALTGQPWSWDTIQAARLAHERGLSAAVSDWRASAEYRMVAAQNLLIRFFLETCGAPVRIERHPALAEA